MSRQGGQFGCVVAEKGCKGGREEGADAEARQGDSGSYQHGILQYLKDAVTTVCPVIVAGYGLHALIDADDYHDDEHGETVDDTECTDGQVTPSNTIETRCSFTIL